MGARRARILLVEYNPPCVLLYFFFFHLPLRTPAPMKITSSA